MCKDICQSWMKDIKKNKLESMEKWVPGLVCIAKLSIFPQVIYKFDVISIKSPQDIFILRNWSCSSSGRVIAQNGQEICEVKGYDGGLALPSEFQYYKNKLINMLIENSANTNRALKKKKRHSNKTPRFLWWFCQGFRSCKVRLSDGIQVRGGQPDLRLGRKQGCARRIGRDMWPSPDQVLIPDATGVQELTSGWKKEQLSKEKHVGAWMPQKMPPRWHHSWSS